ncbi:MAG: hypothetical protein RSD63_10895 [Eubacterium sp.]
MGALVLVYLYWIGRLSEMTGWLVVALLLLLPMGIGVMKEVFRK